MINRCTNPNALVIIEAFTKRRKEKEGGERKRGRRRIIKKRKGRRKNKRRKGVPFRRVCVSLIASFSGKSISSGEEQVVIPKQR